MKWFQNQMQMALSGLLDAIKIVSIFFMIFMFYSIYMFFVTHTWLEIATILGIFTGLPLAIYLLFFRPKPTPPPVIIENPVLKIPEQPVLDEPTTQSRGRPRKLEINEVLKMLQDQGDIPKEFIFDKTDNEWEELYKFWKSRGSE